MTHGHTATATAGPTGHTVAITIGADILADVLVPDEDHLSKLCDAMDEAAFRHTDAQNSPAGPVRDFALQEAVDAFAAELGDITVQVRTTAGLQLAEQLVRAAGNDPRLAPHPYLVEMVACVIRRLTKAQELINGEATEVTIPPIPSQVSA